MKTTLDKVLEASELLPTLWVEKYGIKNESGLPIEFEDHRFMRAIYNDMTPLQVILKAPQIGATIGQIIKTFWVAKKLHKDIIYTLPSRTDINDMAGGKINRLIAQNPILFKWVKEHDSVEQKSVGDNIIYYRGTWSSKDATMVSSQLNVHDEVDASSAEVITSYETRQQAQEGGWRWYFSHPSLSGFGVDIYWQQSDKKEWFVTCSHCKKEQTLTWKDNVDREAQKYICKECKEEITNHDRRRGKWISTSQGKFSGYHISQLMCPWISARTIVEAYEDPKKDEKYFYNYVLGLPYVSSKDKISSETVLKNVVPEVNTQEGTIIIGVDTGLPIHYVCLNKQGVFHYGTCKDYDVLENMLKRWKKSIIVSDQGGDLIGIRTLREKYAGRVFLCYYRKDRKTDKLITWGKGEKYGNVTVDRNNMIQLMVEQLRDVGRIRLNGSQEDWKDFAEHFDNIYRVKIETNYGVEYRWERNGADHWVHSLCYALVGLDAKGTQLATIGGNDIFAGMATSRVFLDENL